MLPETQDAVYAEALALHTPVSTRKAFKSCARRVVPVRDRIAGVVGIVACTVLVWFNVSQGARIDEASSRIDGLQAEIQQRAAENASLMVKVNELQQPNRILGIAMGRLHMQFTAPVQIQSGTGGNSN